MAIADTLKIFETLRRSFDEQQARTIASAIEGALEETERATFERLATKTELKELKVDILKWMVTLWITQMIAILALFFK
ncbi:MAG: hypothetical protein HYY63_00970 [Elusimicrobia bacterium]|nr:hypothetical protein [Elusimicrobiota bacterium]